MDDTSVKSAYKISIESMVINVGLFIFKLICGLCIRSSSLVSDAVHSLSDVFSTAVVMIGIKISSRPADKNHPYGHDKVETVVAFLLALALFVIGGGIGYDGVLKIIHPSHGNAINLVLNSVALFAALVSIISKEWMYQFTMKCAKAIGSGAMEADAWHHRSDAMSSVGSFIGVLGIRLGYPMIDAIACLIISLFIFKAAYDIMANAFRSLVDHACSDETVRLILNRIISHDGVISIDALKTRPFGSKIYVDLEITADKNLTLLQAHAIAAEIHDDLENNMHNLKHCMIHVNPSGLISHHHV